MSARDRGKGLTSTAIQSAPHGAIYIWCAERLDHPRWLAHNLRRDDIQIRPISWLLDGGERLRGSCRPIVIDHAVRRNAIAEPGFAVVEAVNARFKERAVA